ncbi:MAG: 50S ribosomal protein L6 [Candidatus Woesebacteria bacterium GW2011_GWA1_33_30]|uniref:Large ribosomal subunit protein uL6 n=1 Tax=Candidatus Woesebacteria bacterium GW2011_GWA2_33_28 TaxID=1618561 RepID=A0A0G0A8W2_9BACT|nr:MAG: 50S ribosomal protein L6 [Candidatus Woesebacteria bacterium GW2011_GWA2_33_28]KKP48578.1 MAG: 50S ribosomal protein L6 [Candidatus Woesebacteria bacterium GW2011_GWA1_33_30]KKP49717.1 MAG: 50S ribosomal protein L6 [Microgenomates group bacterium GW2011_GWC1_33_32]KKP52334.1 MAG: 50S ribosomal protein L6 [Candidatus Woesebacteria bacterium GW2011_GWB1_33_38]KKP55902.1 MAG: 50S ribosomal protein L6 [Microgenomates group bacterium GW2011_GWD1_33_9]
MSKIGQLPIQILDGVTVDINNLPAGKAGKLISINGPKGKLAIIVDELVTVKQEETNLLVSVSKTTKFAKSIWGTTRKLIDNMVKGVSTGWSKKLELVGTGYRAEVQGNTLVLTVGYSHPIKIEAPEGINFKVEKGIITVDGVDRAVVGQISANIRGSRPPEPYKGKGVKYIDEVIRRKAGKAAKAATA